MRFFKNTHRLILTATLLALLTFIIPWNVMAKGGGGGIPDGDGGTGKEGTGEGGIVTSEIKMDLLECLPGMDPTDCSITFNSQNALSALNSYLRPIFPWMIAVAIGLTVLMIIIGGFQIMLSGGEQGGQSAGKERIKAVLIGLMILLFSAAILSTLNAYYYRLGGSL